MPWAAVLHWFAATMTFDFPGYALAYLINTFFAVALAIAALRRRHTPGAAAFAGVMLAASIWSLAQFFEAGTDTVASKVFWSQIQYIGVVAVPPLWLLFAVRYSRSHLLDGARVYLLWIIPLITLALVWTNPLHSLVWTQIELLPGDQNVAVFTHGLWFWMFAVFAYSMVIGGSALLVRACLNAPRVRQYQTAALVAGALAPLVANVIYLMQWSPLPGIDLTAFAFTFTGLLYLPTLFGLGVLDLTPVAREAVVEQMSDAVLVVDASGRIADLNASVAALLGVNTQSWLGVPFTEALAAFPELAALGGAEAPEQSVITLSANPPVYLSAQRTTLKDGKARPIGTLLLLRDITQVKVAELHAFDLALEHERVRLLSRFIRDASHEFRTPLAVVNTSLYLMDRQTDPAQQRTQRDKIAAQVDHLNTLLEDMLTMSKLDDREPLALSDVDINALLTDIVRSASLSSSRRPTVSLDLAEGLRPVRGDAAQLQRALDSLFSNAIQYTAEGGAIQIATRERGDFILITLQDTGIGIDHGAQSRIFERFFRSDDAHTTTGLGLGLPIARAIIEAHGGMIEVQSTPGQGSTFTLQLPAQAVAAPTQPPAVNGRLYAPLHPSTTPAVETP